jgi:hypothetical protein
MTTRVNHKGALEFNDHNAILVDASCLDLHDPDVWARFGLPFLENLAARVNGVSFKYGIVSRNLIPAQIGEGVLRIGHRLTSDEGEGKS